MTRRRIDSLVFFSYLCFRVSNTLKKAVSIFLVLLLLFNALGFFGLLQGLRYQSARDLVERLDHNKYSTDETVTIKIPFSIPYQLDSDGYQRVDGEIEYESEFYRLVKQKLEKDTLYIVAIKDHASNRINQALADYVKTFTDKPINTKNTSKISLTIIKDFLASSTSISHASDGWNYPVSHQSSSEHFDSRTLAVFTPPPQF